MKGLPSPAAWLRPSDCSTENSCEEQQARCRDGHMWLVLPARIPGFCQALGPPLWACSSLPACVSIALEAGTIFYIYVPLLQHRPHVH